MPFTVWVQDKNGSRAVAKYDTREDAQAFVDYAYGVEKEMRTGLGDKLYNAMVGVTTYDIREEKEGVE